MKLEKFNYSNGKRSRWFLYGFIMCAVLMVLINLFFSEAKYFNTESIKLAEGTISYKPNELNIVAVNIENDNGEYTYSEDIPTSGYYLDDSKSYCEVKGVKDNSIKIEYTGSKLEVTDISKKGTRCYAYFNKTKSKTCVSGASACETIMANINTIGERTNFRGIISATSNGMMYQTEDDYGTSYYYAGNPLDNFLIFGTLQSDLYLGHHDGPKWNDVTQIYYSLEECQSSSSLHKECYRYATKGDNIYWRIVRINGDGTIRITLEGFGRSYRVGEHGSLSTPYYNKNENDNAYVGYMFGSAGSDNHDATHNNLNSSNVKQVLDSWYEQNILNYYDSYLSINSSYCSDRTSYTYDYSMAGGGYSTVKTIYGSAYRIAYNAPSLKCPDISNDLFTTNNATIGNKALTYPIGLLTADELFYSGLSIYAKYESINKNHYLFDGFSIFTMSPYAFDGTTARIVVFYLEGIFGGLGVTGHNSLKPVLNLRADVTLTGTGTQSDPYVVQ